MNRAINFTANFTYKECYASSTATARGIDNTPNDEEYQNCSFLAHGLLQPLRDYISKREGRSVSFRINSWFRGEELNKAVGGSPTSDHRKGLAADIVASGVSLTKMKQYVTESGLAFDQFIMYPNSNSKFFHISLRPSSNRKMIFSL